jgi:hypothetical protein
MNAKVLVDLAEALMLPIFAATENSILFSQTFDILTAARARAEGIS